MYEVIENLPSTDDQIYPAYKIALIVNALRQQGTSPEKLLEGTGLSEALLSKASTRITRRQLTGVYRNVVRFTTDSGIALRTGQRVRATDYGMYGYALLSSARLIDALNFAMRYHKLATPTVSMHLYRQGNVASFEFKDLLEDEYLLRFNIELQLSLVLSLFRDALGEGFSPREIYAVYPRPVHYALYKEIFGCPVHFNQASNRFCFDEDWLNKPPLRSNPITQELSLELCDKMMLETAASSGVARQVYCLLMKSDGQYPNIDTVAQTLYMTSRTLRRKLERQGTSYNQLIADVRKDQAIRYLRKTRMTTDDIAERLGFSNASNFRAAFKRWTNKTPSMYRSI